MNLYSFIYLDNDRSPIKWPDEAPPSLCVNVLNIKNKVKATVLRTVAGKVQVCIFVRAVSLFLLLHDVIKDS